MSERWKPKQLLRARAAEIARGAPVQPMPSLASVLAAAPHVTTRPPELLCRLHNQPWRTCSACSTQRQKAP
jgi:hypothetical protein